MLVDCEISHAAWDIALSLLIIVGMVVSYLPQHVKIIRYRTSEGISPWYMLLGALSSFSNLTNAAVLQLPYVSCCSHVQLDQCLLNLLGFWQLSTQWTMFFLIFLLYMAYFPEHRKVEIGGSPNEVISANFISEEWKLAIMVSRIVKFHMLACLIITMLVGIFTGMSSKTSLYWANILGFFSLIMSLSQFLPQIVQTWHSNRIGALSIPAMLMQTPGSFIFCYTLAISPGTRISTWITFFVGGCLQGTLLIICLYFRFRGEQTEYIYVADSHNSEESSMKTSSIILSDI